MDLETARARKKEVQNILSGNKNVSGIGIGLNGKDCYVKVNLQEEEAIDLDGVQTHVVGTVSASN